MRQTSQWLEQDWEAIKLVPQRQYHANLLNVVARRITFEEVGFAAFLLLNVEIGVLKHRVGDEGLHELLRVDL